MQLIDYPQPQNPVEAMVKAALAPLSPATRRVYAHHLNQFLTLALPLTREGVAEFAYSAPTVSVINQRLSALKQLVNESLARNLLDYPTAHSILSLKSKRKYGETTGNWLTLEQCKSLLDCPSARDRALLALLIGCGLRRAETASLTLSHWQLRDGRRVILDLIGKRGRVRTIPVPPWVESSVQSWLDSPLFPTTSNHIIQAFDKSGGAKDGMTATGVWWIVTERARAIGVTVTPHDLRRTYAKLSRLSGAPLDQLQVSLGHSNVATTQRYVGDIQNLSKGPGDYWEL